MKLARELPQKLFFSPKELAEEAWLGFTEDEIWHLGAAKRLSIHTFAENVYHMETAAGYAKAIKEGTTTDDYKPAPVQNLPLQIHESFMRNYINPSKNPNAVEISFFTGTIEGLYKNAFFSPFNFDTGEFEATVIARNDLVVLRKSLEKFEGENPDIVRRVEAPVDDTALTKLLDDEHPWYSHDLALAVKAWLDLYIDHEGDRNDNNFKPYGGHPKMIADWLEINHGTKTNPTSRKSIAAVVNPCDLHGSGKCKPWHKPQK